jgi:hypothetical protein
MISVLKRPRGWKVEKETSLGSANRRIWFLSKQLHYARVGRWAWAWIAVVALLGLCVSMLYNFI